MTACFICANNDRIGALPPREEILVSGAWRVAHAFGTSLPGWFVVVPNRHVTAMHELSADDAAEFGRVIRRCSRALCDVIGCEKAYVAFFAEAAEFEHLHVHVIPRMAWFGADQRGPSAFSLLGGSAAGTEVGEDERDALALRLRAALQEPDEPPDGRSPAT